jgi:hypothetical protein
MKENTMKHALRLALALLLALALPGTALAGNGDWIRHTGPSFTGTLSTGQFLPPAGAVGAPSYSWAQDPDTGIYQHAVASIDFSINGVRNVAFQSASIFHLSANPALRFGATSDTILQREGAAIWQSGADVNGAVTAQTFKACDGVTGTDIAGCNQIIAGGRGTGAGTPGNVIFQTAPALGTGTTPQVLATRMTVTPTEVKANVGTGSAEGVVGGALNVNTTVQATTGTIEEVLATYTLPANTLSANGKGVRVTAAGLTAANGNTKTMRVRFGGIGGTQVCSSTTATSGVAWHQTAEIFRTGAATQITGCTSTAGTAANTNINTAAQTLSGTVDIVVTGTTATASGDATLYYLVVEAIN